MANRNEHLGKRKDKRVGFQRPGFVILEPGGPWLQCLIIDISTGGACINVGELELPKIFILLLSAKGEVRRTCQTIWRRADLAGVQFLTTKDLKGSPDYKGLAEAQK